MNRFIKIPNLPGDPVVLGIVDFRINNSIESKLRALGIKIIKTERIEGLYEAVAYHPDLQVYHAGGGNVIIPPNVSNKFAYRLQDEGVSLIIGEKPVGNNYPYNICYNAARVGNNLICNTKYIDKIILDNACGNNLNILHVKQGYSKCSICVVGENAIITSDAGIANSCIKAGIDCLKIVPEHIVINGLNYGFIGGASGYISSNELGFYGDIRLHPDFSKIKDFLDKYKIKYISLGENLVHDFGTFIPLKEYSILTK